MIVNIVRMGKVYQLPSSNTEVRSARSCALCHWGMSTTRANSATRSQKVTMFGQFNGVSVHAETHSQPMQVYCKRTNALPDKIDKIPVHRANDKVFLSTTKGKSPKIGHKQVRVQWTHSPTRKEVAAPCTLVHKRRFGQWEKGVRESSGQG